MITNRTKYHRHISQIDSSLSQFFTKLEFEEKIKSMQDDDSLKKCLGSLII